MVRQIIKIDEDKCNGCGACASACNEGAIEIVNGKAKLIRDDYCDGLGNCLPNCPTNAISFEEREAAEYDEEAVKVHMEKREEEKKAEEAKKEEKPHMCPGSMAKSIRRAESEASDGAAPARMTSQLAQWPCQIKLVPENAPYFNGANLLIAADCTAYAYANIHQDFMRNRVTLIGCPKLDAVDYAYKLTDIIAKNDIKSVTVLRMEVPCCGGMERAVKQALQNSGKFIPWRVVTISSDGRILSD